MEECLAAFLNQWQKPRHLWRHVCRYSSSLLLCCCSFNAVKKQHLKPPVTLSSSKVDISMAESLFSHWLFLFSPLEPGGEQLADGRLESPVIPIQPYWLVSCREDGRKLWACQDSKFWFSLGWLIHSQSPYYQKLPFGYNYKDPFYNLVYFPAHPYFCLSIGYAPLAFARCHFTLDSTQRRNSRLSQGGDFLSVCFSASKWQGLLWRFTCSCLLNDPAASIHVTAQVEEWDVKFKNIYFYLA